MLHKTVYKTIEPLWRYISELVFSCFLPYAHQLLSHLIWLLWHDLGLYQIPSHSMKTLHKTIYESSWAVVVVSKLAFLCFLPDVHQLLSHLLWSILHCFCMFLGSFKYLRTPWRCSTKLIMKRLSLCLFSFLPLCSPPCQYLNLVHIALQSPILGYLHGTHSNVVCKDHTNTMVPWNGKPIPYPTPLQSPTDYWLLVRHHLIHVLGMHRKPPKKTTLLSR